MLLRAFCNDNIALWLAFQLPESVCFRWQDARIADKLLRPLKSDDRIRGKERVACCTLVINAVLLDIVCSLMIVMITTLMIMPCQRLGRQLHKLSRRIYPLL